MKRAKVSSVYEGGRIKGTKEEEERISRRARMKARARKHACRINVRAQPFVVNGKIMKHRSMIMRMEEEEKKEEVHAVDEEKKPNKEVVLEPEIEKNSSNIKGEIVEAETGGSEGIAKPMEEVMMGKYWEEEAVWWEECWPIMGWNYEEQWSWSPYWETMSGIGSLGDKQDEEEPWEDDLWNLKDIGLMGQ